jgi:light-regulated signal transduction histidine kinase (bacteriophytochrome)
LTRDRIFTIGETLPAEDIRRAMSLIERLDKIIFSTDNLCSIENLRSDSGLAGMLAWKISAINNDWIMCFRPEQVRSVKWAGQPQKEVETVNGVTRLNPRGSFALWVEQVKNTSEPWTDQNIETAEFLRQKILELRKETLDRNKTDLNKNMTARDEFVANIAHDLKTPILGAIRVLEFIRNAEIGNTLSRNIDPGGSGAQVRDAEDKKLEDKSIVDENGKKIASNGHREKAVDGSTTNSVTNKKADANFTNSNELKPIIDQLINSHRQLFERVKSILILYQYSEDTAPLSVERLDVEAMLRDAINMSRSLAISAEIEIELDVVKKAFIVGDKDAFQRVFENLLSNAVKFSEIGGKVLVSLDGNDSTATVRVHDNGKGIPEQELGLVFKRFWRGAIGKKYTSGSGLGLHVCRKIIESHDGKIWCESVEGKGTTLFVELPIQKEDEVLTANA